MIRAGGLALVRALSSAPFAFAADDDDDDKVPAAEVEKIEAALSALGCKGYESVKKEEQGTTTPSARWARSISNSTRTTRSS